MGRKTRQEGDEKAMKGQQLALRHQEGAEKAMKGRQ
jgi:hypothetical protein